MLVISGLSIIAVEEEPKAIADMGVFVVTSIASLFAYIWLYLVLEIITPNEVDLMEAWLTLVYFFALIFIAFAADKYNEYLEDSRKT